ncbi:MAG: energy transducer TonB [Chitinophagaceae bacterium]|jgi:TonB family protein
MKKFVLITVLTTGTFFAHAQTEPVEAPKENTGTSNSPQPQPGAVSVFTYVEQMPEFPGGQSELLKYLKENLKYPEEALDEERQGKVYVKFVVDENGDIKNAMSVRPIGYGMDEEAVRVVESMPQWKPGKQNGKAVKVYFQLPIMFSIPKDAEDARDNEPREKEIKKKESRENESEDTEPKEKKSKKKKEKEAEEAE